MLSENRDRTSPWGLLIWRVEYQLNRAMGVFSQMERARGDWSGFSRNETMACWRLSTSGTDCRTRKSAQSSWEVIVLWRESWMREVSLRRESAWTWAELKSAAAASAARAA